MNYTIENPKKFRLGGGAVFSQRSACFRRPIIQIRAGSIKIVVGKALLKARKAGLKTAKVKGVVFAYDYGTFS